MTLRIATLLLISATAVALAGSFFAFATDDFADQPRLEIIHAGAARIVFRDGKHVAVFTDAEVAYGELKLFAEQIKHDSSQRTVNLSGEVRLRSPEYSLNTRRCSINLATGFITADDAVELISPREGLTVRGKCGSIWVEPATHRVLKVALAGDIAAEWDKGITLWGGSLNADFARQRHAIEGDFTAAVDAALLPTPLSELSGEGLMLSGNSLSLQANEGTPQMLSLSASAVDVKGDKIGLYSPELKARLAFPSVGEGEVQDGMLHLSGSKADPASGWILDDKGKRTSFSAQYVEKAMGARELVLKSGVLIASPDFSLRADSVSIAQQDQSFRVYIPERFRVVISPEVFRKRSFEAAGSEGS